MSVPAPNRDSSAASAGLQHHEHRRLVLARQLHQSRACSPASMPSRDHGAPRWRPRGRGRSAGSSSCVGQAGQGLRQYSSLPGQQACPSSARRAARAATACSRRTAPAAASTAGPRRPVARRVRRRSDPGRATSADQPSLAMWCINSTSTCSSGRSREQPRPHRQLAGQVEDVPGGLFQQTPAGSPDRPPPRSAAVPRPTRPAPAGTAARPRSPNTVRSDSCLPTTSRSAAASAIESSSPRQPPRVGHVVGRARAVVLVHEPQPLLREGQRQPLGPLRYPHQRRPGLARRRERPGERGHRRVLEHRPDVSSAPKHGPDPADQPDRQQRVAAEVEEVVVDPDPLDPEDLREQFTQRDFLRSGWFRTPHNGADVGHRQSAPVQFSVHRQR